jgi:hypothetical protein
MFHLTLSRLLAFAVFALTSTEAFSEISYRVLAAAHTSAAMEGGNLSWSSLSSGQFDAAGNVCFYGQAYNQFQSRAMIVRSGGGSTFHAVIKEGQSIPGFVPERIVQSFMDAGFEMPPGATANGWIAARVFLRPKMDHPPFFIPAILKANAEEVQCVASEGTAIPNSDDTIASISPNPRIDADGNVTFFVTGRPSAKQYLLRHTADGLTEVARAGGPAPAEIGGTFDFFPGEVLLSTDGSIVYTARIIFPGKTVSDAAVLRKTNAGTTPIMRRGEQAAGLPEGWTYGNTSLHLASCNASGKVLFKVQAVPPNDNSGLVPHSGYWLADGTTPAELIVLHGQPISESNENLPVNLLREAVVNAGGDVAFYADGICLKRAGQPAKRIAFNGMATPGIPGGTFQQISETKLQLSANGVLLFTDANTAWVMTRDENLTALTPTPVHYQGRSYLLSYFRMHDGRSGGEDGLSRSVTGDGKLVIGGGLRRPHSLETQTALVEVTLPHNGEPNTPPIAQDDLHEFATRTTAPTRVDALSNDSDGDHDSLTIVSVTQAREGSVSIKGNSIIYTPNPEFGGEDQFTYTIADGFGGSNSATVTMRNYKLGLRGTYETSIVREGTQFGSIEVSVSASGRVTGRLFAFGRAHRLSGKLNPDGSFGQNIEDGDPLLSFSVGFTLSREGDQPFISGEMRSVLKQTNQVGYIDYDLPAAPRNTFRLPENVERGRVSMHLTPALEEGALKGIGFAVGSINSKGRIILAGRRPDGVLFATATSMRMDNTTPIYLPEKSATDSRLFGTLTFTGGASEHLGDLRWEKPAIETSPYSTVVKARMAPFTPPKRNEHTVPLRGGEPPIAELVLTLPNNDVVQNNLSLSRRDLATFTLPNRNLLRMKINRHTGLVSGSFQRSGDPEPIRFYGSVYQPLNFARGCFTINGGAGAFELK